MDGTVTISLISIVISVIALAASTALALRQTNAAKAQVVISFASLLSQASRADFVADVEYVRDSLPLEVPNEGAVAVAVAVSDLPEPARTRARRVANYFDQLGLLVNFNVLAPELVIGYIGNWLDQVWRSLEPCIYAERDKRDEQLTQGETISGNYLAFFEDLVVRARSHPPPTVHGRLRLRRIDSA